MTETSTVSKTIGDSPAEVDRLGRKARALSAAAEWLDEHGVDLPLSPYIVAYGHLPTVHLNWHVCLHFEGEEQKAATAQIVRVVGGKWDKQALDDRMLLEHSEGDLVFEISVDRGAVCQRVVTGTREVIIPAVEATPARTETVEDVEWVCGSILDEATS